MGLIDNIKRIIQGFNKKKESDFILEDESTLIIEDEPTEDESPEDEDQSTDAI